MATISYPSPLYKFFMCLNEMVQSILSKSLVIENIIPNSPRKHLQQNFTLFRDKIWLIRVLKKYTKNFTLIGSKLEVWGWLLWIWRSPPKLDPATCWPAQPDNPWGIRVASAVEFSVCLSVGSLYVTNFLILLQHNIRLPSRNCGPCAP